MSSDALTEFQWQPQPASWETLKSFLEELLQDAPVLQSFAARLRRETGTRLIDWLTSIVLPENSPFVGTLISNGFCRSQGANGDSVLTNDHGLFPPVVVRTGHPMQLVIRVDDVDTCVAAHFAGQKVVQFPGDVVGLNGALITLNDDLQLCLQQSQTARVQGLAVDEDAVRHKRAFAERNRQHENALAGFEHAATLIDAARYDLGCDLTCELFFAAEREYWQSRNRAARVQKARQDRLGLGWENHDHHTYRSSRACFVPLITTLERLGLRCRERFYAGWEAGWGAQVMEHPKTGIVVFADVDLSPEEVGTDFAHEPLPDRNELGTVGLWCRLHGESFLRAGMHHLECQFDFDAARDQLAQAGVETMAPFTDFSFLRQAFTQGEIWPVTEERIASALTDGSITDEQATHFRGHGALGSHLEILERNDGYKGFNQTGVSDIIQRTDPRKSTSV